MTNATSTSNKKKIVIDPVSRVEGHGRVTLHLGPSNKIEEARLHIVEFRGFERFVQGRPYWEAPVLVQRLCGICPVSHHLCSAKAIDEIVGQNDATLPETARQMRRLMHYGQVLQSHALHYFYLAAPDLLLGIESEVATRNVVGLAALDPELAKKGILIRKFGQEIIKATAGKRIHGISAVPGGIHKNLSLEEREQFVSGKDMPSIDTIIAWCEEVLELYKAYYAKNRTWMDAFLDEPANYLSLVGADGEMDLYHGNLRCIAPDGTRLLDDVDYHDYVDFYAEEVKEWSYMKFPYLKTMGPARGWMRVGPLARINVCDYIPTPKAQRELEFFRSVNGRYSHKGMHYHWARLIEMLFSAERIKEILDRPALQGTELVKRGDHARTGIGFLEAPRGTLIHHYEVARSGEIERCNLIVSTTHNNEAMNQAVREVADRFLSGKAEITEGLLNHIEVAIRAYDPCLSCATHAVGQMPLKVQLYRDESIVDEFIRD
jgi:NAD-reducing hydrogenase large subunit